MEVVVGRVARAHGVSGELAVDVYSDLPAHRFAEGAVLTGQGGRGRTRDLTVRSARSHGSRLLIRFEQVPTREAAEELRGYVLMGDTADLPPVDEPDEFYDHELIGLAAEYLDGTSAGTVGDVLHTPGGDVLVLDHDGAEVLVPFVRFFVPSVDVQAGRLVLDPPDGLIE